MRKLAVNIAEITVQGVAIVLLFISGMFRMETTNLIGEVRETSRLSFVEVSREGPQLLGNIVIILMFISVLVILAETLLPDLVDRVISSDKIRRIIQIGAPVVSIAMFVLFSFIGCGVKEKYRREAGIFIKIDSMFIVEMFLLLMVLFFALIKTTKYFQVQENNSRINMTSAEDNTELNKLIEYKRMLDQGLIDKSDYERVKNSMINRETSNVEWKADYDDELPDL